MPQTERDLLLADINRLRLVMASPSRYWRRGGAADEVALLELALQLEHDWAGTHDEAAYRKLRLELPGRVRKAGFALPDAQTALGVSGDLVVRGPDGRRTFGDWQMTRAVAGALGVLATRVGRNLIALGRSGEPGSVGVDRASASPLDPDRLARAARIAASREMPRALLFAEFDTLAGHYPLDPRGRHFHQHLSDLTWLNRDAAVDGLARRALIAWLAQAERLTPLPGQQSVFAALRATVEGFAPPSGA